MQPASFQILPWRYRLTITGTQDMNINMVIAVIGCSGLYTVNHLQYVQTAIDDMDTNQFLSALRIVSFFLSRVSMRQHAQHDTDILFLSVCPPRSGFVPEYITHIVKIYSPSSRTSTLFLRPTAVTRRIVAVCYFAP